MTATHEQEQPEQAQELPTFKAPPFKDFGHYAFWWMLWMGGLAFLNYTEAGAFSTQKVVQTAWGLGFGAACAFLFTLIQNAVNPNRRKVLSWVIAIAVAVALKFLLSAVFALVNRLV